ncbi:carboxymuconolactone decarboxylase family protein [Sporosarcina jiandibaonis]
MKELIAIAVAHTTGCPYCIEVHVKAGKSKM